MIILLNEADGEAIVIHPNRGGLTVTEEVAWSWRYEEDEGNTHSITLVAEDDEWTVQKAANIITFTNNRVKTLWLSGENFFYSFYWNGESQEGISHLT